MREIEQELVFVSLWLSERERESERERVVKPKIRERKRGVSWVSLLERSVLAIAPLTVGGPPLKVGVPPKHLGAEAAKNHLTKVMW